MCVYLHSKFQVSSIILAIFRQSGVGREFHPLIPHQNGPLKSPPRLGLKAIASAVKLDMICRNTI